MEWWFGSASSAHSLKRNLRVADVDVQLDVSLNANKRYKRDLDHMADEYVCPITLQLPVEPVIAEDGRCYEKRAIEEWFTQAAAAAPPLRVTLTLTGALMVIGAARVKSPVTNLPMGKKLLESVHILNTIQSLVDSGAISGHKADAWKRAMDERASLATLLVLAEGDSVEAAVAMSSLAFLHRDGKLGLEVNFVKSFAWFKRAADLDDTDGLVNCGRAFLDGKGVEKNTSRGITMLAMAAALGSERACSALGNMNKAGVHGFKQSNYEASLWYNKMKKCRIRDSSDMARAKATAWLRAYP